MKLLNNSKTSKNIEKSALMRLKNNSILVIDDHIDNLRLLTEILSARGYKVRASVNGELALKSININPPDLILLDIIMPEIDGYEVCRQLKANRETATIPVIFLSALGEEIDKVKAFELGACDYITKPFQLQEVLARINYQLKIIELQKQLQAAEAKYRNIFENAIEGLFQSSLERRYLIANAALARILGYQSPEELLSQISDIATQVYVESDRYQQLTDLLKVNYQVTNFESKVYRKDGTMIWICENVRLVRNEQNQPLYYEGNVQEITERKALEARLLTEKEFAQTTLKSIGDGVIVTDTEGYILDCNPMAEELTGWKLTEIKGHKLSEVLKLMIGKTGQPVDNPLEKAIKENRIVDLVNGTILLTKNGLELPIQDSAAPIKNSQGEIVGGVMVFYDATASYQLADELYWEANHDYLTGLYNRRAFKYYLEEAIATAQRDYLVHVLCYLDLDDFKKVNDLCGHEIGDQLLTQISRLFSQRVKPRDILARLGGDEFGLLLYDTSLFEALEIVNSLRTDVIQFRFLWQGKIFNIGVSVGIVTISGSETDSANIIRLADEACYEAKNFGRNCISVYQPSDKEY